MEGGECEASPSEFGIDLEGFLEVGSGLVEDRHFGDLVRLRMSYLRLRTVARVLAVAFFFATFLRGVRFATGFA